MQTKEFDGIPHEFNPEKAAWFPILDDALLEQQQSVYKVAGVDESAPVLKRADIQKKRKLESTKVPDVKKKLNTSIYVQGLPLDADIFEIAEYFKKCGIIQDDIATGEPKIKIYLDDKERPKGDALVVYFKEESVEMAINLLDDTIFRDACAIKVTKAVFQEKAEQLYTSKQPAEKSKMRRKMQKLQQKLEWEESDQVADVVKTSKTVLLKHMFTLLELEKDPTLLLDLKEDVRDECSKLGEITNVVLYDKSEEGVMTVRFKQKESASACIKVMNGRWFSSRKIVAEFYDGKAKYLKSDKLEQDDETERLANFSSWLEESNDE